MNNKQFSAPDVGEDFSIEFENDGTGEYANPPDEPPWMLLRHYIVRIRRNGTVVWQARIENHNALTGWPGALGILADRMGRNPEEDDSSYEALREDRDRSDELLSKIQEALTPGRGGGYTWGGPHAIDKEARCIREEHDVLLGLVRRISALRGVIDKDYKEREIDQLVGDYLASRRRQMR